MTPTRAEPAGPPVQVPRPATPRTARLINDRAAYDLLLADGPLTRAQLRERTGLSGPTVADLVTRLEDRGLVTGSGTDASGRRGPNAVLYAVVPDAAYVVGVDMRPTGPAAAAADLTGAVTRCAEVRPDPSLGPADLVEQAVRAALPDGGLPRLRAVVVGTRGLVDPRTGDVTYVAGLPRWQGTLTAQLRDRLGVDVVVDNEVNLVGVAEHRLGAARGADSYALLSLADGIGVAVVLGGRLHRGASGGAGEAGYLQVGDHRFQDLAGGAAVLALASSCGLAPTAAPTAALPATLPPPDLPDGAGLERLHRVVVAAVELVGGGGGAGEGSEAAGFLAELADRVARGAANVCAVLDPGLLVLGGVTGAAGGSALADRVERRLAALVPAPTTVRAAEVRGDAVVAGAHLVALDRVRDVLFA